MLIEIVGRNQTFFRRIAAKNWHAMVKSVPTTGWTIADLDRLHKLLWDWTKPAKISSTGIIDATVIDDQDDIENSQLSWEENHEALVAECEHRHPFEYEDRNGEPHLGCKDCGGTDV